MDDTPNSEIGLELVWITYDMYKNAWQIEALFYFPLFSSKNMTTIIVLGLRKYQGGLQFLFLTVTLRNVVQNIWRRW